MIIAEFSKNVAKLKGHAGYAEIGKDIVCAAATGIWYALSTKLEKEEIKGNIKTSKEELSGYLNIQIRWIKTGKEDMVKEVLDTAICGLQRISVQYPENLIVKSAEGGLYSETNY